MPMPGADGIFVPGLTDLALIEKFVQLTPLPVNIMVMQGAKSRISPASVFGG
jgi:2-methylisocitrate lyase-like PEP mutase family enzyme